MDDLLIRRLRFDDPVVVALVADLQAEFVRRYGGPDETPLPGDVFEDPHGRFFVGFLGGAAVSMGGWRWRPDVRALGRQPAAEVKRMYVVPAAQRRGLGRRMLRHLEDTARDAGAEVLVLETGVRQPEALALYESAGYLPVEPFGHYRDSPLVRCLGLPLTARGSAERGPG